MVNEKSYRKRRIIWTIFLLILFCALTLTVYFVLEYLYGEYCSSYDLGYNTACYIAVCTFSAIILFFIPWLIIVVIWYNVCRMSYSTIRFSKSKAVAVWLAFSVLSCFLGYMLFTYVRDYKQDANYGGYYYYYCDNGYYKENEDGTLSLCAVNYGVTELIVPEVVEGKAVTSISVINGEMTVIESITSEYISSEARELNNLSLTSIIISDSVISINDWAFRNCTSLTHVYYNGTLDEWNEITIESNNSYLTSATIYYYAENDGTVTAAGNYWYYDINGEIVEWVIKSTATE